MVPNYWQNTGLNVFWRLQNQSTLDTWPLTKLSKCPQQQKLNNYSSLDGLRRSMKMKISKKKSNAGQEIKKQVRKSETEKESRQGGMNRDWCQWEVMYRGEGDESEPASLSAPVVMSFSKTSLIFNGARLQERGENRSAQTSCTHTHTVATMTYAHNTENYRLIHTYTKCPRKHTHLHSAAQMQTRFSES